MFGSSSKRRSTTTAEGRPKSSLLSNYSGTNKLDLLKNFGRPKAMKSKSCADIKSEAFWQPVPTIRMLNGKCMCCDSSLKYPQNVSCFRCTVCKTVNETQTRRIKDVPQALTIATVLNSIDLCRKESEGLTSEEEVEGAYRPLIELLARSFSDMDCLNQSFLSGRVLSLAESGVSLPDVRSAYEALNTCPSFVMHHLVRASEQLVHRPGRAIKTPLQARFLLTLLEIPSLSYRLGGDPVPKELLKRLFGIISGLSNDIHHHLVNWFGRLSPELFKQRVELINSHVSHRLANCTKSSVLNGARRTSYENDWQIKAAARTMALFFAANTIRSKLPVSDFYNTMVDYIDLLTDFFAWEKKKQKFLFCQYPFFISLGQKQFILENDAKRQMETKAREAFFSSLDEKRVIQPHLILSVRRDHLVEDSLREISLQENDLKKSLRIQFIGEEGVDAGGLRKEWFLLLCRELFDRKFGLFDSDEESNYSWFSPNAMDTSGQFFLVGVVLGLAIYNSTILDIQLPSAAFKKLLGVPCNLADLALLHPNLARGLQTLLDYEGDVESTFCLDFVVDHELCGKRSNVPLVPGGENRPVTNANRKEYVNKYVKYLLDDSCVRQFFHLSRGFFQVCGGNALSLFRAEEIELLVRGSPEPLDVQQLESIAVYDGSTKPKNVSDPEPVIVWFWALFQSLDVIDQRRLLSFVTGSDRIPATGAANLSFRISVLGNSQRRLPVAHTCFNQLCLHRYKTQELLKQKLLFAVRESSGFGLK